VADKEQKYEDNADGKFYVDITCIDCDACRQIAPDNFARNDEANYSYVYKQPENETEADLCKEALEGCPVEAIGEDGP
jgi:ferredoxin